MTGGNAPRFGRSPLQGKQDGHGAPRLGMYCMVVVKKKNSNGTRSAIRQKFTIQKHTSVKPHTAKPKFHKNIPTSNHDLTKWCKYLNIPIKDVLSRDQTVPHNRGQTLRIYNLEPSYMSGSHWVSTYVKDGVINYFDSFGMPQFQEIVNHARSKNLTLPHQNNRYKILTQQHAVTSVFTF